jgi:hypothetical protein
MPEKILKSEKIVVTRKESNFDRACEEAYSRAVMIMGIDDCGHSDRVKGWDRSRCHIQVVFERYEHIGSMVGHEYNYIFRGEAVRGSDND